MNTTLLITGSPPGNDGVGQQYLRSICRLLPMQVVVAALLDSRESYSPQEGDPQHVLRLERRYEHAFRPVRGRIGEFAGRLAARSILQSHARSLVSPIADFARSHQVDSVFAVMDCPTSMLLAAPIASSLGVPLRTLVWDMPDFQLGQLGHTPASGSAVLHAFDRALRQSEAIAVMSREMAEEFGDRHGGDPVLLRQPVDPDWLGTAAAIHPSPSGEFVIGFAGSVTAKAEMEVLMGALDRSNWMVGGKHVRFRVFGQRYLCHSRQPRWIEYRGYQRSVSDVVAGLSECDLLFLPQPFSPRFQRFTDYSFPTKLTTYLAARKPVLLLAPESSALSRFFAHHDLECRSPVAEPDAVLDVLTRFVTSAAARDAAVARLATLATSEFSESTCRARLGQLFRGASALEAGTPA